MNRYERHEYAKKLAALEAQAAQARMTMLLGKREAERF